MFEYDQLVIFVYSIVRITRFSDYQTADTFFEKFRGCAKVCGLFLDCAFRMLIRLVYELKGRRTKGQKNEMRTMKGRGGKGREEEERGRKGREGEERGGKGRKGEERGRKGKEGEGREREGEGRGRKGREGKSEEFKASSFLVLFDIFLSTFFPSPLSFAASPSSPGH